jgi:hypothetical protein
MIKGGSLYHPDLKSGPINPMHRPDGDSWLRRCFIASACHPCWRLQLPQKWSPTETESVGVMRR